MKDDRQLTSILNTHPFLFTTLFSQLVFYVNLFRFANESFYDT